jgi:lipopolysaccharide heptosyltransferase II
MSRKMEIKRVLFFKPGAIGDLLHTLPALKSLKHRFPTAHVCIVVTPELESLIQGTPIADSVLVFDKTKLKKSFRHFLNFGLLLRNGRYDLFVDLQPSLRSFLLRWLSGAKLQLVYRKQKKIGPNERRLHAAENFMETLKPLGITDPVWSIELPIKKEAQLSVESFLSSEKPDRTGMLIALNCSVGAARPARNWFPERFAELGDRLIQELGATVVFIGGKEDRDLVSGVIAVMKQKALSAVGVLSIAESAALLARCACLVSSDTGPLHLATAVQTPVVGLFGSTDPARTGPIGQGHHVLVRDLACIPCEGKSCLLGTRACMDAITVDEVFKAVRKVIE